MPHLERALTLAEALDQPETLAEAMNTKGVVLFNPLQRPREGTLLLEGALALALEHDLYPAALRAYNNLGAFFWVLGDFRSVSRTPSGRSTRPSSGRPPMGVVLCGRPDRTA